MSAPAEYPARQALMRAVGPVPPAARVVILALSAFASDEMLSALAECADAINGGAPAPSAAPLPPPRPAPSPAPAAQPDRGNDGGERAINAANRAADRLARDKKIVSMRAAGMSYSAISEALGVSAPTIAAALKNPAASRVKDGGACD